MSLRFSLFSMGILMVFSCHHRDLISDKKKDSGNHNIKNAVQFLKGEVVVATFDVEIARTDEERAKGLMFRESLPEGKGMLFIFEDETDHYFWMKNTRIPLDMIFIDSNLEVVGVYEWAEPMSEHSIHIGTPSRYVLEINGGLSKKLNIHKGTRAIFINISP